MQQMEALQHEHATLKGQLGSDMSQASAQLAALEQQHAQVSLGPCLQCITLLTFVIFDLKTTS